MISLCVLCYQQEVHNLNYLAVRKYNNRYSLQLPGGRTAPFSLTCKVGVNLLISSVSALELGIFLNPGIKQM